VDLRRHRNREATEDDSDDHSVVREKIRQFRPDWTFCHLGSEQTYLCRGVERQGTNKPTFDGTRGRHVAIAPNLSELGRNSFPSRWFSVRPGLSVAEVEDIKLMKRVSKITAVLGVAMLPAAVQAECGEVSITEMNWASAQVVTSVASFLMEEGYGCEVTKVPSDTVPAVASVAETGEPDIMTEMWKGLAGDAYQKLVEQKKIIEVNDSVLDPGGVSGWWIPTFLAEAHPELTTIEGIMANPELVGARFNNCPVGWGCRVVSDNLVKALALESKGFEIFDHGSGETLATSMASAVLDKEPWFGYYWAPTVLLGKYDMTKIDLGPVDLEVHARNRDPDTNNPGVSDFPPDPVVTAVTTTLETREPEIVDLMSKISFPVDLMSATLAWKDDKNASIEEASVYFLRNHTDIWSEWLNDEARANLAGLLRQ
jgi:glycine betaine/proline transport system substrate-binding protein